VQLHSMHQMPRLLQTSHGSPVTLLVMPGRQWHHHPHLVAPATAAWVVLICVSSSRIYLPGERQAAVRVGVATAALGDDAKLPSRLPASHTGGFNALIGPVVSGCIQAVGDILSSRAVFETTLRA